LYSLKKVLSLGLLAILALGTAQSQELYDNFDDSRFIDYGFINGEFFPYTPNPDATGVNTSATVAQYQRNPVELFDVIVMDVGEMMVGDYIAGTKNITLDVYPPAAGITVQFTLEDSVAAQPTNYPTGRRAEFTAVTTVANQWETLTFSLVNQPDPGVPSDSVNRMVLLFNPGVTVLENWYYDNLNGPERAEPLCDGVTDEPLQFWDFDCEQDITVSFRHGLMFRDRNPDNSGSNTSSHSGRYERNVGELVDVLIGEFPTNLTVSDGDMMSYDVYDLNAPSVYVLALQDASENDVIVLTDSTDAANTWTSFNFDLSSIAGNTDITRFVLLYKPDGFNVGITYLDNLTQTKGSVGFGSTQAEPLSLQPNPASQFLQISVPQNVNEGLVQIFDMQGRMLTQLDLQNQGSALSIDVSKWLEGSYVAVIRAGEQLFTSRFIVVH
jgi:hypothetical protein